MSPATERAVERQPRVDRDRDRERGGSLVIPASVVTLLLSLAGSFATHRLDPPPPPAIPLELVQRVAAVEERERIAELTASRQSGEVLTKLAELDHAVSRLETKIDQLTAERRR